MKYQNPSFAIAMPGSKVSWPFPKIILEGKPIFSCPVCGAIDRPGETHITAGHTNRIRQVVCFGLCNIP